MLLEIIKVLGPWHTFFAGFILTVIVLVASCHLVYYISRAWHHGRLDAINRYGK